MGLRPAGFVFETWFWSRAHKTDTCWIWMGTRDKDSYGMVSVPGHRVVKKAHRVAWSLSKGFDPPSNLFVMHTCDMPACVRPSHLVLGTARDNNRDAGDKGRTARGEKVKNAVLTEDKVRAIRELYAGGGYTHKLLAEAFGVSVSPVSQALARKTWRHI